MFPSIGFTEILIILVIVLLLFGANKLPSIGSDLGKAIRNFKRSFNEPEEIDVDGLERRAADCLAR